MSQMPPTDVLMTLRENTHTGGWLRFRRPSKIFQGKVAETSFSISRVITDYRNSFVPEVTGEVMPDGSGSRVHVTMELLPFVKAFMRFWFGFLFIVGLSVLFAAITSFDARKMPLVLIPVVMCVFGYALTHGAFRFDILELIQLKTAAKLNHLEPPCARSACPVVWQGKPVRTYLCRVCAEVILETGC